MNICVRFFLCLKNKYINNAAQTTGSESLKVKENTTVKGENPIKGTSVAAVFPVSPFVLLKAVTPMWTSINLKQLLDRKSMNY